MADKQPSKKALADEKAAFAKIAEWPAPYPDIGTRLHEVILAAVPELKPRLWYGGVGYALSGPVLCFVRVDDGNMSFGITEKANITVEDGAPDQLVGSAWFLSSLDTATEERVAAIVRRAAS